MAMRSPVMFRVWWWLIRLVTPLCIVAVFLNLVGLL